MTTTPPDRISQLRALLAESQADDVLQALGFKRLAGLLYLLGPERVEEVLDYAFPDAEPDDAPASIEDHLEARADAIVQTRADFDRHECENCHCTDREFDLLAHCHATGRTRVRYDTGVLKIRCAECERPMMAVQVASA